MSHNIVSGDPWDLILKRPHLQELAMEFRSQHKRAMWCRALFEGGNTLRLWNEATELKIAFLTACALQRGQKAVLIGKYAEESGVAPALRSLIGQEDNTGVEEILTPALAALQKSRSASGARLQWDFHYFDSLADKSLDLFGREWKLRGIIIFTARLLPIEKV